MSAMIKIQVINGPNLNLLGIREPDIYGTLTLKEINAMLRKKGDELNMHLDFFQSNHEGDIIDKIQDCYGKMDGIVINPGAYTHYSIAIRDAIAAVGIIAVEVHLSDINSREDFRKISVIKSVCVKQIWGKGADSYTEALEVIANKVSEGKSTDL